LVITSSSRVVGKEFVGLLHTLEFVLGGIALRYILDLVRVALEHSFAMGGPDLGDGGISGNPQRKIRVYIRWRGHDSTIKPSKGREKLNSLEGIESGSWRERGERGRSGGGNDVWMGPDLDDCRCIQKALAHQEMGGE
jgi:hypothetical protein